MTAAERAARRDELRREYRRRKARELDEAGWPELAAELLEGRCACGCGDPLDAGAVRRVYIDQRHRQTFHRARVRRAAEAAGVPSRLSLKALEEANRTSDRNGDAPARRKRAQRKPRAGVTVYFPTIAAAAAAAACIDDATAGAGHDDDSRVAAAAVERALARRRARAA